METLLVVAATPNDLEHEERLLADATGKPLVVHAWENAKACTAASAVVATTSSKPIADALLAVGADVVMTAAECVFPTDRLYDLYRNGWDRFNAYLLLHANEPEVTGRMLDLCAALLIPSKRPAATLAAPLVDPHLITRVKLQVDADDQVKDVFRLKPPYPCYRGVGVFAYRPVVLKHWRELPKVRAHRWDLELAPLLDEGTPVSVKCLETPVLNIESSDDYRTWYLRRGK